jgi:hypothetical protein
MRKSAALVTIVLALAAWEPTARAQQADFRVNFIYTGKIVTYTVPETGTYRITAFGAQGGSASFSSGSINVVGPGGRGAEIGGDFSLTAGEMLEIAVGGAGGSGDGGGGGGSFVVGPGNTPLVIAGGGGGGGFALEPSPESFPGQGGLTGPDGEPSLPPSAGGTGGNGGAGNRSLGGGAGGGGFFSAGGNGNPSAATTGGGAFPDLTGGSAGGGFGGGGGASGGSGGGGGYSGGGGGGRGAPVHGSAGGGGSFDAGSNQVLVANLQIGDGEVVISKISPLFAGMPGKANCHSRSVLVLVKQYGGLNNAAAALGFDSVKALEDAIEDYCEA